MNTVLIVIVTVAADYLFGYLWWLKKKRDKEKADKVFLTELELILGDKRYDFLVRKANAAQFCRNYEGELATGAYVVLNKLISNRINA